jgi:hypothetical protein
MLLLEGISSLSLSLKQPNLLRIWSLAKGGMMIEFSNMRGVHILSRKRICACQDGPTYEENGCSD